MYQNMVYPNDILSNVQYVTQDKAKDNVKDNSDLKSNAKSNIKNCQSYLPECLFMPKLAHAYVPFQYLVCLYTPLDGLEKGTIFPELDRPYGTDPEYTVDA